MVIHLGKPEVFERQIAKVFEGGIHRNLAIPDLFEEALKLLSVHQVNPKGSESSQ